MVRNGPGLPYVLSLSSTFFLSLCSPCSHLTFSLRALVSFSMLSLLYFLMLVLCFSYAFLGVSLNPALFSPALFPTHTAKARPPLPRSLSSRSPLALFLPLLVSLSVALSLSFFVSPTHAACSSSPHCDVGAQRRKIHWIPREIPHRAVQRTRSSAAARAGKKSARAHAFFEGIEGPHGGRGDPTHAPGSCSHLDDRFFHSTNVNLCEKSSGVFPIPEFCNEI